MKTQLQDKIELFECYKKFAYMILDRMKNVKGPELTMDGDIFNKTIAKMEAEEKEMVELIHTQCVRTIEGLKNDKNKILKEEIGAETN